jgi:uncharacterized cupin superfamily protein
MALGVAYKAQPMSQPKQAVIVRASDVATSQEKFSHPWNPKSEVRGAPLSSKAGLERVGVNLIRISPGKESFVYHSHSCEEEWMYVLSGKAAAEIDGQVHELGPGDFVAFPVPSVAHHVRNPFGVDLVYLSGGENRDVEIADFPKLNRRLLRRGEVREVVPLDAAQPFKYGP